MKIRFLDAAQQEFDEAVEYYNAESIGLGDQFLLETLDAFQRVRQFPTAGQPYTQNSRRCQTRRFPYGVVYQVPESSLSKISRKSSIALGAIESIDFHRRLSVGRARWINLQRLPSSCILGD